MLFMISLHCPHLHVIKTYSINKESNIFFNIRYLLHVSTNALLSVFTLFAFLTLRFQHLMYVKNLRSEGLFIKNVSLNLRSKILIQFNVWRKLLWLFTCTLAAGIDENCVVQTNTKNSGIDKKTYTEKQTDYGIYTKQSLKIKIKINK